ncbi:hypothetical protein [Saccharopolyspora shandongensis]|uniref:hypothetical protein n=1 Tax=Saccharopolyspora shandongensis TaxID=418495 RepID=UPI0033EAE3D2
MVSQHVGKGSCSGPQYRRVGIAGFVLTLAYGTSLVAAYVLVIAPAFGYEGYTAIVPNLGTVLVFVVSYIAAASQLPARLTRPSQLAYWILFLLVVAPVHVTMALVDNVDRPNPLPFVLTLSLSFMALSLIYRISPPGIVVPPATAQAFWVVMTLLTVGGLSYFAITFGVQFRVVSFDDVYDVRRDYTDSLKDVNPVGPYIVGWIGYVLGPALLATGLVRRSPLLLVAGGAVQLLIYSLTGFKSVMVSILLLAVLAQLSRRFPEGMVGPRLVGYTAVGVGLITFLDFVSDGVALSSLFVRRLMLSAGINSYNYYDYFARNPKVHLGHSVLAEIVDYPYQVSPAHLIGEVYYGNSEMSANANIWADAYANFGLAGMILCTVLLGGVFIVYDGLAQQRDLRISALLIALPGFTLCNSGLLTSLLTHGLLLAMVVLAFMPWSGPRTRSQQSRVLAGE